MTTAPNQWTYLHTRVHGTGDDDVVTSHMNTIAAQGWDLVSATGCSDAAYGVDHYFYWRRLDR